MADQRANSDSSGKLTKLPIARIKTIMRSSPDLSNVSQESVFMITKATELFVHYLTNAAHGQEKDKRHLTYKGLSQIVVTDDNLQFLGDIVPPKVRVKDYYESLKKQKDGTIEVPVIVLGIFLKFPIVGVYWALVATPQWFKARNRSILDYR